MIENLSIAVHAFVSRVSMSYIYSIIRSSQTRVITSGQENHSGAEHLNFPGGELNVIFLQSNISLRKKPKTG